jgi:gliding motility-associated-like protein
MSGVSNTLDGDVHGMHGNGDIWVVAIDDSGNLTWSQCYGGSFLEYSYSLQETRDGGLIITGYSESSDGDVTDHIGNSDFWTVKLGWKIATAPVALQYCAGDSLIIKDTLFGTFNPNNIFSVQLSDINGSFANPTTIGSFLNSKDSVFRVALPAGIPAGTKYRLRVESSSPKALYFDNRHDITIVAAPALPIDFLGKDTTQCNGNPVTLLAPFVAGYQYAWQDNSTGNQFVATASGKFFVTVTNAAACAISDTIAVQYNSIPNFTLGNDTSACSGDIVALHPTLPPGNYVWNNGSQSPGISLVNEGWYWLQVNSGQCSKRDSLFFTMKPKPVVRLGNDTAICKGVQFLLDATTSNATYLWQDGSGNPTLAVDHPGIYSVRIKVDGCDASDEIAIGYDSVPSVELGKDTSLCTGETILLDATYPGAQYVWTGGSQDSRLLVSHKDTYMVSVSNGCGTARDTIHVDYSDCTCFVSVPSAFTPNNDRMNNVFKAFSRCTIENYELRVYNRYGEIVFASRSPAIGWDGTFHSQQQPMGTFVWTLQYKDPIAGKMMQRKGAVQLIR